MFKFMLLGLFSVNVLFSEELTKEIKEGSSEIKIEEKKEETKSFKLPSQNINEEINSFTSNLASCPNYTKGFSIDKTKLIKDKNYKVDLDNKMNVNNKKLTIGELKEGEVLEISFCQEKNSNISAKLTRKIYTIDNKENLEIIK